jgi:hypothetical protein
MQQTHLTRLHRHPVALAATLMLAAMPAFSASIDTGNPDFSLRTDLGVRYTLGVRGEDPDAHMYEPANVALALGNRQSKAGDVVVNRLDLLGELDFAYKRTYGFRISAAGWWDPTTYSDSLDTAGDPFLTGFCNVVYTNCEYSDHTKRFYSGPSAEILDAFLFGTFQIGPTTLSAKIGRHNLYWGNGLFSSAIAVAQGPIDGMKAQMSPGIELKELYMPQKQVSATLQLTDELSAGAYRSYEWRHDRMPESGTFFDASSTGYYGPNGVAIRPGAVNQPSKRGGDWGLMGKWVPIGGALPSTGLYYREFFEKAPYGAYLSAGQQPGLGYNGVKNKLIGLSFDTTEFGANWGLEIAHRKEATLRAGTYGQGVGLIDPNDPTNPYPPGARGNVWNVVFNAVKLLPKTLLWEGGSIAAELAYQRLDKVTYNPTYTPDGVNFLANGGYVAVGSPRCLNASYSGPGDVSNDCATKDAWSLALNFQPQWTQALPGVDLTGVLYVMAGLKGNSPTGQNGMTEGQLSYSLGLQADVYGNHSFKIAYSDLRTTQHYTPSNAAFAPTMSGSGSWPYNDRGWLSFTYKTSF